jgi:alpha-methylacyl-CoA racemase
MSVAASEPQFYTEFLQRIGIEDPQSLPSRADQANWPALRERFEALFRTKTRAEWCALLEGTDACVSPVLGMDEAADHPHNRARGTFIEVNGVNQPAPAPRFSRTPAARPVFPDQGRLDAATIKRWGLDELEVQGQSAID